MDGMSVWKLSYLCFTATQLGFLPILHIGDDEVGTTLSMLHYLGSEMGLYFTTRRLMLHLSRTRIMTSAYNDLVDYLFLHFYTNHS